MNAFKTTKFFFLFHSPLSKVNWKHVTFRDGGKKGEAWSDHRNSVIRIYNLTYFSLMKEKKETEITVQIIVNIQIII